MSEQFVVLVCPEGAGAHTAYGPYDHATAQGVALRMSGGRVVGLREHPFHVVPKRRPGYWESRAEREIPE